MARGQSKIYADKKFDVVMLFRKQMQWREDMRKCSEITEKMDSALSIAKKKFNECIKNPKNADFHKTWKHHLDRLNIAGFDCK